MGLSDSEMAAELKMGEDEYRRRVDESGREFCQVLNSVFGISLSFLLEGTDPLFDWRPLPVSDILRFRDERNWKQFHTPKDLAISITLEASELLECFQWSAEDVACSEKHHEMEEELADIIIYAVQFADAIGVDIPTIIHEKLLRNNERYPEAKAMDSSKKYKELE